MLVCLQLVLYYLALSCVDDNEVPGSQIQLVCSCSWSNLGRVDQQLDGRNWRHCYTHSPKDDDRLAVVQKLIRLLPLYWFNPLTPTVAIWVQL